MFVRCVFSSGERAGGASCGFWRASLPVITFPLMREGPLSCYYQLSPGLSHHGGCLVGNNNVRISEKQSLFILHRRTMKKLVPRQCLGRSLIVWPQSSPGQEEDFRQFSSPHRPGSRPKLAWMKMGTFSPQTGNPWPRIMGKDEIITDPLS